MSCYNSTVVNVPIEQVWKTIRSFHDLAWAAPVITSAEPVGDKSCDQIGAKRILNGVFHETLTRLDDHAYVIAYTIDDGPEPISKLSVSNYVGSVRLLPVTDNASTFVEWTAEYESQQPDAVAEFCNPIYIALLAALKKYLAGD